VKKELNFEVNIMPVLDILSVMICFLLLTAVWSNIQTIDVKQAVGDNNIQAGPNPPSIWAILSEDGKVELSLRDLPKKSANIPREKTIAAVNKDINWVALENSIKSLKQAIPDLKVALVMPKANSNYGSIIKILDQFRKVEISDVGVAPL
jgi:biopolymer transport protein ExbD